MTTLQTHHTTDEIVSLERGLAFAQTAWGEAINTGWTLDDSELDRRSDEMANNLHQTGIQFQTEAGRQYSAAMELRTHGDIAEEDNRPGDALHYRVEAGKLERHAAEMKSRGDALRDMVYTVRNNMRRRPAPEAEHNYRPTVRS
jgi:hypothetical protein